jgi:hypothetical protein
MTFPYMHLGIHPLYYSFLSCSLFPLFPFPFYHSSCPPFQGLFLIDIKILFAVCLIPSFLPFLPGSWKYSFSLEYGLRNQTKDQATLDLGGFAKDGRPPGQLAPFTTVSKGQPLGLFNCSH